MVMAKVSIKGFLLFCSRRSFAVVPETVEVQLAALAMRKAMDSTTTLDSKTEPIVQQKESVWMKDPKTGNWIPKAHFGDTDLEALREKFLPRRPPFKWRFKS